MSEGSARASTGETQWFTSAVDLWLGALIVAVPLITIATVVIAVVGGEGVGVALLACVFVAALYGGLVVPVKYGLAEDHLIVRFGIVRQRIAYRDITRVRPTMNPLSSPALSLKRLSVETGAGFMRTVMISPANRSAFLDELARRTGLRREGDVLQP